VPAADFPYYQIPWLISRRYRDLDVVKVVPQRLRLTEIDPVLQFVGSAFFRIELEFHGIDIIPLARQVANIFLPG
jgi:hypothetical protein